MRVLPLVVAAAICGFAGVALAQQQQPGPGSNQPPGQATTTQSSEQSQTPDKVTKKAKKSAKKPAMKKEM